MRSTEAASAENPDEESWSILEGEFIPSNDFPDEREISLIKSMSAAHSSEDMQRRIFYTELLIYALRHINSSIDNNPDLIKRMRRGLIDATIDAMHHLGEHYRKQDVKVIAEERLDQPMDPAQEVPIMQAFRAMQEKGVIDYPARTMLDAVVRGIHIKQVAGRL